MVIDNKELIVNSISLEKGVYLTKISEEDAKIILDNNQFKYLLIHDYPDYIQVHYRKLFFNDKTGNFYEKWECYTWLDTDYYTTKVYLDLIIADF